MNEISESTKILKSNIEKEYQSKINYIEGKYVR